VAVKRVDGVEDAKFSYASAEGWVTFDTTMTSPEDFLAELSKMTDFSGTVREFVSAESVPADEELEDDTGGGAMNMEDADHDAPGHVHSPGENEGNDSTEGEDQG
jgi:hypothetical protein